VQPLPLGADDEDEGTAVVELCVQGGGVAGHPDNPEPEVLERVRRLGQVGDPRVA
jgi:hypothetical protein